MEVRFVGLENVNNQPTIKLSQTLQLNCTECAHGFEEKSDLKRHITALHPKKYKYKLWKQIFETSHAVECHLKDHDAEEKKTV